MRVNKLVSNDSHKVCQSFVGKEGEDFGLNRLLGAHIEWQIFYIGTQLFLAVTWFTSHVELDSAAG